MSFDINISKIKCSGKHGIYNHEKQSEQEFLVDIHINISDFFEDNINKTINYEEIVDLVIKIVSTKSFDLIETLAKYISKQLVIKIYGWKRGQNLTPLGETLPKKHH